MPYEQEDALADLKRVGAIITDGHFVYASRKHGSAYVNKDAIYPYTGIVRGISREMARPFRFRGVEVVAGPEKGGIILSQWVAHWLSFYSAENRQMLAVYAEKENGGFVFRRGYEKLVAGRRVLIAEDILTTGGSVRSMIGAVRALGGTVVGVTALCNRGDVTSAQLSVPRLSAYMEVPLDAWDAVDCPLCKRGVSINTEVGKGREYLAELRGSRA